MKRDFDQVLINDTYGIMPSPISAEFALAVLTDYLLDDSWYIAASVSPRQANTCVVDAILKKYSKQYRKDLRELTRRYCNKEV